MITHRNFYNMISTNPTLVMRHLYVKVSGSDDGVSAVTFVFHPKNNYPIRTSS